MSDLVKRAKKESAFAPANGTVRDLYFEMIDEIERLQREKEELDKSCKGLQIEIDDYRGRLDSANEQIEREKAYQKEWQEQSREQARTIRDLRAMLDRLSNYENFDGRVGECPQSPYTEGISYAEQMAEYAASHREKDDE